MTLFKRSWPNAVRSSGAVCISCDSDRSWCKVSVGKTQFDQSDKPEPLPTACVVMTSMISEDCFCRAQSCKMLCVFVGTVGVSPTYRKSFIWTAGETHGAGERTCALPCFSSGRSNALGIVWAFLFGDGSRFEVFFHLLPYLLPLSMCWLLNYRSLDHLLSCLHCPSRCANQAHGWGLWEALWYS